MASRSEAEKDPLDADACLRSPRARRGGGSGGGCLPPWQWPRRSMPNSAPHTVTAPPAAAPNKARDGARCEVKWIGRGEEGGRDRSTVRTEGGRGRDVRGKGFISWWWCVPRSGGRESAALACQHVSLRARRSPARRHQPAGSGRARQGIICPAITYVVAGRCIIARPPGPGRQVTARGRRRRAHS